VSPAPQDLLDEFRKELKDQRRCAIIDAYIKKPSADAMSAKALELLAKDLDAIEKP
jgi:hypothetical protein